MQLGSPVKVSEPRNQTELGNPGRGGREYKYVLVPSPCQALMFQHYPRCPMPSSPGDCGQSLTCYVGIVSRYLGRPTCSPASWALCHIRCWAAGLGVARGPGRRAIRPPFWLGPSVGILGEIVPLVLPLWRTLPRLDLGAPVSCSSGSSASLSAPITLICHLHLMSTYPTDSGSHGTELPPGPSTDPGTEWVIYICWMIERMNESRWSRILFLASHCKAGKDGMNMILGKSPNLSGPPFYYL